MYDNYKRIIKTIMSKVKEQDPNEISINGISYVRKDSIKDAVLSVNTDGLPYVICCTYSAGVHAGYLQSRDGKEAKLLNARRLWYWDGAASLSQLAMDGVSKPENCKFPCEVTDIVLTEVIEVIPCTEKARVCIKNVKIWQS